LLADLEGEVDRRTPEPDPVAAEDADDLEGQLLGRGLRLFLRPEAVREDDRAADQSRGADVLESTLDEARAHDARTLLGGGPQASDLERRPEFAFLLGGHAAEKDVRRGAPLEPGEFHGGPDEEVGDDVRDPLDGAQV